MNTPIEDLTRPTLEIHKSLQVEVLIEPLTTRERGTKETCDKPNGKGKGGTKGGEGETGVGNDEGIRRKGR